MFKFYKDIYNSLILLVSLYEIILDRPYVQCRNVEIDHASKKKKADAKLKRNTSIRIQSDKGSRNESDPEGDQSAPENNEKGKTEATSGNNPDAKENENEGGREPGEGSKNPNAEKEREKRREEKRERLRKRVRERIEERRKQRRAEREAGAGGDQPGAEGGANDRPPAGQPGAEGGANDRPPAGQPGAEGGSDNEQPSVDDDEGDDEETPQSGNPIIQEMNKYRKKKGRQPWREDRILNVAAMVQARHMARINKLTHTGPKGQKTVRDRIIAAGGRRSKAVENCALTSKDPVTVVQQWIKSPGHNRNLLSDTSIVGVGVDRNDKKGNFVAMKAAY